MCSSTDSERVRKVRYGHIYMHKVNAYFVQNASRDFFFFCSWICLLDNSLELIRYGV